MAIINETLEMGKRILVWKDVISILIKSIWNTVYKSTITNMATAGILEVISNKFNVKYALK
jgi:hypothetical protein